MLVLAAYIRADKQRLIDLLQFYTVVVLYSSVSCPILSHTFIWGFFYSTLSSSGGTVVMSCTGFSFLVPSLSLSL